MDLQIINNSNHLLKDFSWNLINDTLIINSKDNEFQTKISEDVFKTFLVKSYLRNRCKKLSKVNSLEKAIKWGIRRVKEYELRKQKSIEAKEKLNERRRFVTEVLDKYQLAPIVVNVPTTYYPYKKKITCITYKPLAAIEHLISKEELELDKLKISGRIKFANNKIKIKNIKINTILSPETFQKICEIVFKN